jgi:hypothetical protein
MSSMDRLEAWNRIHDRLPPRWRAGRPSNDPASRRWTIVAVSPTGGRRKVWVPPEYIEGSGATELEALDDLAQRLPRGRVSGRPGARERDTP